MTLQSQIIAAIDEAPLNRGLSGADWLAFGGNVPVTFENGDLALFERMEDHVYQTHFLFVGGSGREAIEHGKEALRVMFTEHAAELIFGLTPVHLRHARIFNRWIGGKSAGFRPTPEGLCELFVLSNIMWKGAV